MIQVFRFIVLLIRGTPNGNQMGTNQDLQPRPPHVCVRVTIWAPHYYKDAYTHTCAFVLNLHIIHYTHMYIYIYIIHRYIYIYTYTQMCNARP